MIFTSCVTIYSKQYYFYFLQSNQRTEILSWNFADLSVENTLRSHTRSVSDIDWHPVEPGNEFI